ncbi:MAG: Signal recognition particle subunit SRP68 [Aureobasidium pullulans]|nr:MAG: Signal recognition particle subunit SRP68 [Aureobasidium pullulans]
MSNTNYPNLNPQLQNAKDAVVNTPAFSWWAFAASLPNQPYQQLKPTRTQLSKSELLLTMSSDANAAYQNIANGPAAEKARIEGEKTSQEYSNLMDSKRVPEQPAATGQSLTHYHSFFYNLLSWENPRVTTISFASILTFIFFTRYVPILKYLFKALYIVLGITAAAEVVGKLVMNRGFASQMRPRKYYTIPRETLEASLDDVEQLINFFVIEFQRIMFGENVFVTVGAFFVTFISYFLVKIMPTWGLALLFTTLIYTVPLVYINNREVIDAQIENASTIINEQTQQVRTIAAEQTQHATDIAKSTATDLSNRASELIGQAKHRAGQADAPNPANLNPAKNEPEREIKKEDIQNAANDLTNKAAATAQDAANKTSATAQDAANKTSATAQNAYDSAASTAQVAADKTSATAQSAADKTSNATGNSYNSFGSQSTASQSIDRSTEPLTEFNAPSVPTTEPSAASHTLPVLKDENVYHENSAPEQVREEAPLL